MEFGDVQEGVLGVSILNRNSKEAIEKGINEIEGVYISDVEDNSGAKKAGIKNGDIIKKLDNVEISKFTDLSGYLKTKRPNDIVNVEIIRDDESVLLPVTLSKTDILKVEFMDMELKNLSDKDKKEKNISHGVLVTKNKNKWLYEQLGITPNYIITDINNIKINSTEDINQLKLKYGSNLIKYISKIGLINREGKREQFVFR
jgi:S1-C subfamily serine protease